MNADTPSTAPTFNIVLFHPEIPHNAGAAGRLALSAGARLHLIKPLGFSLDEKHIRRTGLDYWKHVDLRLWDDLPSLISNAPAGARFFYLTTKTSKAHWDTQFQRGDYLIFGPESKGLPEQLILNNPDQAITIPMPGQGARSLNLSTAVAVVLYEALRQIQPSSPTS